MAAHSRTRKLALGLLAAVVFCGGIAAAVLPASAEKRRVTVTLLGGATVQLTVDVPPGTPLDQIKLPNIHLPVIGISSEVIPSGPATTPATPATPGAKPGIQKQGGAKDHAHKQAKAGHAGATQATDIAAVRRAAAQNAHPVLRDAGGAPTPNNPTFSLALPGPAPIGVPNFFIDQFRIPPFLLPIYQAAGIEYGIPWQVLAAINEIETDYGRNLSISSAGAVGWMQFLPSTWKQYGVDANGDHVKDPYNPVDAIFAAARYLRAAGGGSHLRQAIFSYNHATWYVDSVLLRAKLIGGLPDALIGSLTGLTQGHFPVAATARYADDILERGALRRVRGASAAVPVDGNPHRKGISIFARPGAPVIAVNDGKVVALGENARLGRYVVLEDVYGNRYTYAGLGSVASQYPVPKPVSQTQAQIARELRLPAPDAAPTAPASAGAQARKITITREILAPASHARQAAKERLFANPSRPDAYLAGGRRQLAGDGGLAVTTFRDYFTQALHLPADQVTLRPLKVGSSVVAGTILGRIAKTGASDAHVVFMIRPAGKGAPYIDPKPILDGWQLLESTAIYRAAGRNPFFGPGARNPSIGQILLMSKEQLEQRVLADPHLHIYSCGRRDVEAGVIDRRVLATLEYLVASGLDPTVSSLHCGHSELTTSGNVSEHSTGDAVDIAAVNGVPILGHQGKGSITDITIRRLLSLQGIMKPHQIISLMRYPGTDNTLSLPDHANHIHVGFRPLFDPNSKLGRQIASVLKPGQWVRLIDRLSQIPNPTVPVRPSRYALKVRGSAGD